MELDRFEYEMLDTILEAFGQNNSLTREQILDIFDHDEDYAASMISFLESSGLVSVVGNKLPLIVKKESGVVKFLEHGGFVKSNEKLIEKQELVTEVEQLKEPDIKLLAEKSGTEQTFREHDQRIKSLELRVKNFQNLKYLLWATGVTISVLAACIIKLLLYRHHY